MIGRRRRVVAAMVLPAAVLTLASCRTPKLLCFAPSGLKEIRVRSDVGANNGLPVAVDLLFVTQKKALAEVGDLKSHDYFAQRKLLERKFPKGWIRWWRELKKGQQVLPAAIKPPCNLEATLVFANYADTTIDASLRLKKAKKGTVVLKDDGIAWIEDED